MAEFAFHRPPREVQRRDFERFKDAPYFALWFDPRVGKTKVTYDIFRYRYECGDVDALVSISYPSGVKHVWAEEAQKEFPPDFLANLKTLVWQSGKMTTAARYEDAIAIRAHLGPIVVALNCEAVITEKGWKYLEWLLAKRRVMLVADESAFMANWSARTQKMLALGRRPNVVVKAILDGTPVDEGPIEIFHPAQFLKPGILCYTTKAAFRARYTAYDESIDPETGTRQRINHRTGTRYDVPVGYRNLDELRERMMTFGSRVRREDVSDAPPKVYQSAFFELTPRQRRVYDRLRDEYVAELGGGDLPVAQVLKRMTRLQMVARNYWPPEQVAMTCIHCDGLAYDDDGVECKYCGGIGIKVDYSDLMRIDDRNPAAEALVDAARTAGGPFVVWCRYVQDANDAFEALRDAGFSALFYTGDVPEAQREMNYRAFKDHETGDCIVATEASGLGRGKDLSRAVATIYYSNEFSLRTRRQTEDRTEGVARTFSTSVIDLVAADTRDLDVIDALRNKRDVAAQVVGDPLPVRWL